MLAKFGGKCGTKYFYADLRLKNFGQWIGQLAADESSK